MASDPVPVFAARLTAVVPSRTVYPHAVPATPSGQYLFVYSTAPVGESADLADSQALLGVTVWVASASRRTDRQQAATEAAWGARAASEALRGWRPTIGAAAWQVTHLASQPPQRDEDLPDVTVFYAVDMYSLQYQP